MYASALNKTGDKSFSYILNEAAGTGVSVQVWQVGGGMVYFEDLGALAKGNHSWIWSGAGAVVGNCYKVKLVTSSAGYSGWTKTSTDTTLNSFYSPRGVAVNKNQNSQYFGRIYVTESVGGAATTGVCRTDQDGIYMLNADMSDAAGQGNTARTGGVTWGTTNSPFCVEVGPDNNVYVCDYSNTHSGLWMADANFTTAREVLDGTGRNTTSGLNTTHGSISGFVVEGTGANRKIYTVDEDMYKTNTGGQGSVWRYDIGTDSVFTGAPSGVLYDDYAANLIQNYNNDLILSTRMMAPGGSARPAAGLRTRC